MASKEKDEAASNGHVEMDTESGRNRDPEEISWIFSWRFAMAIIGFFGFVNAYALRIGMSVGIICMVNHTAVKELRELENPEYLYLNNTQLSYDISDNGGFLNSSKTLAEEYSCTLQSNKSASADGPYVWDKEVQGHILGSFFYGYLVSQVPAGYLAEKYGGKWVFAVAMFISGLGTILTPLAAQLHYGVMIFLRVLLGVGSGALYPVMHAIWSQWAPPLERSKLANITYAGSWMGMVLALPISGLLCQYGFAGGWPSIFYLIGGTTLLWTLLWILLASDSPANHKRIRPAEREYILKSLHGQVSADLDQHKDKMPWCEIFKSGPVWAIIVGNVTTDWGLYVYLTNIPTYMFEVLKFDIQSNGFLSALPFIGLWINMNISPIVVDKIRSKGLMSTTAVRKLFMAIGCLGSAILLVGLAFTDCSRSYVAIVLLTIGVTISACVYSAFLVNHMDIAPKYAGTLLGISNACGAMTGFIAPYVVAVMTKNQAHTEWQNVFFLSAAIYAFGAIFYCLFASGEIQEWAKEKPKAEELGLKGDNGDVELNKLETEKV